MVDLKMLQYFRLSRNPFGEPRGLGELFAFRQHRAAICAIEDAIRYDSILTVIAPIGSGKSILLTEAEIRLEARDDIRVCHIDCNVDQNRVTASDIIAEMVVKLSGQKVARSWPARFKQACDLAVDLRESGVKVVLVADEAHCLHWCTLTFLKRLADSEKRRLQFRKLLSVVLVGQPKLRTRIQSLPEIARRAEICELDLGGMQKQHLAFMDHIFKLAGRRTEDVFGTAAAKFLAQHSATPLHLKQNVRRAMAVTYQSGLKRVSLPVVERVLHIAAEEQGNDELPALSAMA